MAQHERGDRRRGGRGEARSRKGRQRSPEHCRTPGYRAAGTSRCHSDVCVSVSVSTSTYEPISVNACVYKYDKTSQTYRVALYGRRHNTAQEAFHSLDVIIYKVELYLL